jgi:hypothetical protein
MVSLLYLGFLVAFVGIIWLIVEAFKVSVVWGVVVLVVPAGNIVFTIVKLDRAWKPVGVFLAGAIAILMGMRALAGGIQDVQGQVERGEITEEEAVRRIAEFAGAPVIGWFGLEMTLELDEVNEVDVDAKIQDAIEKETAVPAPRYRVYKPITVAEAAHYLDQKIKVTTRDGVEREGIVMRVQGEVLTVGQRLHGGSYEYQVTPGDVKRLEVWTWDDDT